MGDKYRSYMVDEKGRKIEWRHGAAPQYLLVNKLFEEGRTTKWPSGSLEEMVENAIKTWEMEFSHKTILQDFQSIDAAKFKLSVNGKKCLTAEEILKLGSYNALLQSEMPVEIRGYRADEESFESSHEIFKTALPRGFAWELLKLYSGPPVITFKFRHWGYMEGPYKSHAPTEDLVQFIGMAILKVDENLRAVELEIFYDPGDLLGGLLKGPLLPSEATGEQDDVNLGERGTSPLPPPTENECPFIDQ